MTIFKEADLETALPKVKKKVKSLVKKGYTAAKSKVTPRFVISEIAKRVTVGKAWNKLPKKQQERVMKLLKKGVDSEVAKHIKAIGKGIVSPKKGKPVTLKWIKNKLKLKKQYGGSIRKAKY
jgi:hypothetical protein